MDAEVRRRAARRVDGDQRVGTVALRPTRRATHSGTRAINRSIVASLLFHDGPMSRADLARETGLTRVTVSELITDLITDGFVEELGQRDEARVGKPATLVGFRATSFAVVVADLRDRDRALGAVVDLSGHIILTDQEPTSGLTGEALTDAVTALLQRLLDAADRDVIGVGVATPGIVSEDGVVLSSAHLGWNRYPLATILGERLGVPVHVENDANAAALAEFTYAGAPEGGFMLITVNHGVGAGIVLDGHLLRGRGFAAGEIGHLTVDPGGDRCSCGRAGCLELELSAPRLTARTHGQPPAQRAEVLRAAGARLGGVLAPIVSALDLGLVLISGPADLYGGDVIQEAQDTIRASTYTSDAALVEVRTVENDEDGVLRGAAVLALIGELGFS